MFLDVLEKFGMNKNERKAEYWCSVCVALFALACAEYTILACQVATRQVQQQYQHVRSLSWKVRFRLN